MVKTRRGRKRTSPQPLENEECESEEKKPKLNSEKISKYFNQPSNTSHEEEQTLKNIEDISVNANNITDGVVFKNSNKTLKLENESDDESSSDEFMKVPFSLDDLGDFESLKKESTSSVKENEMQSINDDGVDMEISRPTQEYYDFSQIIQTQEFLINTKKELEKNDDYRKESAVPFTKNKKNRRKVTKEKDNKPLNEELEISELLAITEGPSMIHKHDESSDEDKPVDGAYSVPEEGVQVTIQLPNVQQKKKSKGFDVEAAMRRRLNLIRKENQVFMHKVHTLCWIAHGIYLNRTINNDDLMGLALSLIPSKHCYPSKHADLNYLEKLVDWFIGKVPVDPNHQLATNSPNSPLTDILELEINMKKAFSNRDLVLIFVCMVRSLGIDARLVISFRSVPIRPPASDLCTISNNKTASHDNKSKKADTMTKADKNVTNKPRRQSPNSKQSKEVNNKHNRSNNKDNQQTQTNQKSLTEQKKKYAGGTNRAPIYKRKSEITSPYFSSSDDVPLKELQREYKSSTNHPTSSKDQNVLNKQTESSKTKKSLNTSKSKTLSTNIGNNNDSVPSSQHKSLTISENKKTCFPANLKNNSVSSKGFSHNLVIDSENRKQEILQRQKKALKNRNSAPPTYQEMNTTSEDEVEIPKRTYKKGSVSKRNSLDSKLSRNNAGKQKVNEGSSESNFETKKTILKKKSIDRRVLSSDDDNVENTKKLGNDFWVEVFLEAEEKWISVDLTKGKVHCIHQLYNRATQPVRYVVAFNNDGSAKDVTRRYAPQWLTVTRRLRVDDGWWRETIAPYTPRRTMREKDEDEDLDRQLHDKPLPTSVAEYKNHPLYALKRHLLKFEAIYPPDAPPLGFVRGEPVYSRGCVTDLHTRETWIKEAKLVRRGEEPYKIVKARPKWDKISQKVINDLPLPLFGHWQVEDYIPPPAVDGKVPRNEYGNVELYKPCMLPAGTVHLQVPQLARVARKLNIDCAPAVVGWEFSGGSSHPVLDGFIVCEEFKEVLLDAWNKEMDESAKRAKEKVEQRVYGNWKRLIKGLLIRERLKLRYDFGVPESKKKKQQTKPGTSKA